MLKCCWYQGCYGHYVTTNQKTQLNKTYFQSSSVIISIKLLSKTCQNLLIVTVCLDSLLISCALL